MCCFSARAPIRCRVHVAANLLAGPRESLVAAAQLFGLCAAPRSCSPAPEPLGLAGSRTAAAQICHFSARAPSRCHVAVDTNLLAGPRALLVAATQLFGLCVALRSCSPAPELLDLAGSYTTAAQMCRFLARASLHCRVVVAANLLVEPRAPLVAAAQLFGLSVLEPRSSYCTLDRLRSLWKGLFCPSLPFISLLADGYSRHQDRAQSLEINMFPPRGFPPPEGLPPYTYFIRFESYPLGGCPSGRGALPSYLPYVSLPGLFLLPDGDFSSKVDILAPFSSPNQSCSSSLSVEGNALHIAASSVPAYSMAALYALLLSHFYSCLFSSVIILLVLFSVVFFLMSLLPLLTLGGLVHYSVFLLMITAIDIMCAFILCVDLARSSHHVALALLLRSCSAALLLSATSLLP
ncbi:uncharacterized protein G2W53_003488 [Senna tora]|uniref:Uncharacterized protein n=1 Tax=Senna tora TaxID=362788 RepID=A0A834XAN7_9FABA|nr:uncharacterized protein G2W53_003488 [Senna tora]